MGTNSTKLGNNEALIAYLNDRLTQLGWQVCGAELSGIYRKGSCMLYVAYGSGEVAPVSSFQYNDRGNGRWNGIAPVVDTGTTWHLEQYGFALATGTFPLTCHKLYYGKGTEKQAATMEQFVQEVERIANASPLIQALHRMRQGSRPKFVQRTGFTKAQENKVMAKTVIEVDTGVFGFPAGSRAVVLGITNDKVLVQLVNHDVTEVVGGVLPLERVQFVEEKQAGRISALEAGTYQSQIMETVWLPSLWEKKEHEYTGRLVERYLTTMEQAVLLNEALLRCCNVTGILNGRIQNGTAEILIECLAFGEAITPFVELDKSCLQYLLGLLQQRAPIEILAGISDVQEMQQAYKEASGYAASVVGGVLPEDDERRGFLITQVMREFPIDYFNLQAGSTAMALQFEERFGDSKVLAKFLSQNCFTVGGLAYVPRHCLTAEIALALSDFFCSPVPFEVDGKGWDVALEAFIKGSKALVYHPDFGFGLQVASDFMFRDTNSIFWCNGDYVTKKRIIFMNREVLCLERTIADKRTSKR